MDLTNPRNIAQERWMILRNVLLGKASLDVPSCSVRIHNRMDLFSIRKISTVPTSCVGSEWREYQMCSKELISGDTIKLAIKQPEASLSKQDLQTSDNTGNVCIWASEQAMAYFVLANLGRFANSSVIELGGGYSCLAGIFLARYGKVKRIVLSDGNPKATRNVIEIAKFNSIENVEVLQLQWNDQSSYFYLGLFDYVLVADCLFRDEQRQSLVSAIFNLLKNGGEGIVFAPKRGKSLDDFVLRAKKIFGDANVEVIRKYNDEIWKYHESKLQCATYNESIHYPIYVKLRKI